MSGLEERLREAEQRLFARLAVRPEERMLALRNGALRLRLLEFGAGEPVLLLHPGGWLGSVWAPLAPHLPGRRLLALDLPGHGLSDGIDFRREPARAGVVALLREVFAALGLSRAPVVANSIGGVFALWLAADAPSLVSSLVLLGSPGPALPRFRPTFAMAMASVPGVNRFFLRLRGKARDPRPFLKSELGPLAFANTPPELFEIHALAGVRPELALTLSTYMEATLRWRTPRPGVTLDEAELRAIEAPVRFVWGEDDAYGPPSIGEHAAHLLPHARVEVRPGGHLPQLDDPCACAASISAFLAEVSPR